MDLTLYIILLVLSLALVALGFYKAEHSELSLTGFAFLFLLSLVMLGGDIQYKTGESYQYGCLCCGNYLDREQQTIYGVYNCTEADLNSSLVVTSITEDYATFSAGGVLSHLVGFWWSVVAVVGFIGVIVSLRRDTGGAW